MNKSTDFGLLLLRLALGGIFIAHGVTKVLPANGGIEGFIGLVASLDVGPPEVIAWFTVVSEIGGGALIALGILPRLGALLVACVMVGAIATVHWKNGFFLVFSAPEKTVAAWPRSGDTVVIPHGFEFNLALLAMALCVLCAGGGAFSLLKSKRG